LTLGGFEHPSNNSQTSSSSSIPLESDPPHPIQLYPAPTGARAGNASDWEAEQLHAEAESSQTGLLPSLGYLDEALGFIAAERAKWSAARENVSSNATGSGSRAEGSREREEGENENEMGKEGEGGEWQHVIGMSHFVPHEFLFSDGSLFDLSCIRVPFDSSPMSPLYQ